MAKQLNIKVHFFVNGAPEHVFYALLEADNPASVAQFMGQGMPIPQLLQGHACPAPRGDASYGAEDDGAGPPRLAHR